LPDIINWSTDTWQNLLDLLGIGLALIAIALLIFILIIAQQRFLICLKHGNQWLGGISLAFAIWGLVAFFSPDLGGEFGKNIITESKTVGVLRLIGLIILGILLIAPLWSWHIMAALAKATEQVLQAAGRSLAKSGQSHPEAPPEPVLKEIQFEKLEPFQEQGAKTETISETEAIQEAKPAPGALPLEPGEAITPEAWEPGKYQPSLTVGGWQLPPLSILDKAVEIDLTQTDVEKRAELITEALVSYGVDAKVVQINVGPTVTQYGVEPGWDRKYKEIKEKDKNGNVQTSLQEVSKTRVKVERINSLANDLALALSAPSIRIEAPIPGKAMVGIEVPNSTFGSVNLRAIIESAPYQKVFAKSKLALALGKGAGGETIVADLAKMPHLLVAGATGSGKTVYLNSVICCLLTCNTPDDLQFIMIDPKRVELVNFNRLPHLIAPVVVDTDRAVMALSWLAQEMDERYQKFATAGVRNIESYNKDRQPGEGMPYIILVIDELADLMMTSFDTVEHTLCRLAQLARATGIHLIVATQRPSVDVVTGLIKANFPTRISFALTSQVDSRTIIDGAGAEKLLGRGDMLFMPTDASKPKRLQGPFLTDAEIDRLVNFWGNQRRLDVAPVRFEDMVSSISGLKNSEDPLMEAARQLAEEHDNISASFLQRRLHIGYPRAARMFDKLNEEGY
jgi:S-DNA-T family DNA segregation ATPase FtsK/SpoIIIE